MIKRNRNEKNFILLLLLCLISSYGIAQEKVQKVYGENTTDPVYSPAEQAKINMIQEKYAEITSSDYQRGINDIYSVPPIFSYPYQTGYVKKDFLENTTKWINYYRFLLNLPEAKNAATQYIDGNANNFAQLGSYLLAASNADPFKYQHNLSNATKPYYIPNNVWNQGKPYTNFAVLYFNTGYPIESAYEAITNLVIDNFDYLSAKNTGHRADLLSSRLSSFGIGVTYGNNGTKYEDIYFDNTIQDISTPPSRSIVNFPAEGVFPIEEITRNNSEKFPIYWSIYFSNDYLIPRKGLSVKLTNNQTGESGVATNVENIAPDVVSGYYASIITYLPPKNISLKANNQYTITLTGLDPKNYPKGEYSYTFKLFHEAEKNVIKPVAGSKIDMIQKGVAKIKGFKDQVMVYDSYNQNHHATGQVLPHDSLWKTFGISYANDTFWFNLGTNQWVDGKYIQTNDYEYRAVATIDYIKNYGIRVWDSPFFNKKPIGQKFLTTGTKWKTFRIITVNNHNWFNVGGNQWIDGYYVIGKK